MQPSRLALRLAALVMVINFITMPGEEYPGDALAVRVETIGLINTGQWAVPPDIAVQCGPRGLHLYENANGVWYSKYGIVNTFLYLPCLWLQKVVTGKLDYATDNIFFLNLLNVVLSSASAFYLALLARLFTRSTWIAAVFVLASLYATFWWNFLRAHTFEIYNTLFLLAFVYHFLNARRSQNNRRHLFAAAVYLGALILCKSVYLILIPPTFVASWFARSTSASDRPGRVLLEHLLCFWIPLSFSLGVLLWSNWYRFGSPFTNGYLQYEHAVLHWNVGPAVLGYFFAKQKSMFLYFPVLIFALASWPAFARKYRGDVLLIGGLGLVVFAFNSAYPYWEGGPCYGPRYLLPVLPLLSLPFIEFLQQLSRLAHRTTRRVILGAAAAVMVYSCVLQIGVNSLPFFFRFQLFRMAENSGLDAPQHYFRARTIGTVNLEYILYSLGCWSPMTRNFVDYLNSTDVGLLQIKRLQTPANYYWFAKPILRED